MVNKKREEHVKRFHNYKLNLLDAYKMPCISRRKPGTYTKSKQPSTESDVVADYLTNENLTLTPATSTGQWKAATNIQEENRFQDPKEKQLKVIWLCLCQKILSKIGKYQGNHNRNIGSLNKLLVVSTYNNTSWTDTKVSIKKIKVKTCIQCITIIILRLENLM